MADEARSRLGRGLASLIGDVGREAAHPERPRGQRKVPIEHLKPNPRNPRRSFAEAELAGLAGSIRQHGVIQPIVARPARAAPDRYEIVAGERRWRAAQAAGLAEVPVTVVEVGDAEARLIAIVENVQREDLNPIEEAEAYHAIANELKRSQDEIAKIVGKSRSHVANMMRLTRLPDEVQAYIAGGELSAGHARALINVTDPLALARRILREGLSVREVETLAHETGVVARKDQGKSRRTAHKDPDTLALEKRVSDALGLAVSVDHRDPGGTVKVTYRSLEQLDEVMRRLARSA